MQKHKDIILSRLLAHGNNTLQDTLDAAHSHEGGG